MLRGVLEAQAPPKQNATDTISVLSNRLASATLLEDRRGAILGLRSFAKAYPASVASGSLRGLIGVLAKAVEDVDTSKVVLETLLMLFNPSEDSPEASDDIALWLADEFSQRQDNITILLSLLETTDFYCRLYALQLLSAVSSARPARTQECILSAPLGTTRLVATLDDARDAIKTAGLLLLTDITQASPDLQKLVAFENAFERIFRLLKSEGSFAHGGIVVQDCLALLANLLDLNPSNQSLFRESAFFGRLGKLLADDAQVSGHQENGDHEGDAARDKNLWGLLAILKMFLVQGDLGTVANQNAFEKQGLLQLILNMGFDQTLRPAVRAEALSCCAEVIKGNSTIQERFAHNKVLFGIASNTDNERRQSQEKVYIIDALLNTTLSISMPSLFDVRYAASECILAYFFNHTTIRRHFLRRAIEGHSVGDDETSNVVSIVIRGSQMSQITDPYRFWFASRIVYELLNDDSDAKKMTMAIKEGDADNGEEVVTCLQAITSNLLSSIQNGDDDRICIAYLMLLCGWAFDDPDATNDILQEASAIQSLIRAAARTGKGTDIVTGLCTVFLGILYEFSTKDSPISRRQLQPLITSGLGREVYIFKIKRLRQAPQLRDFEVLPQKLASAQSAVLPEVYFDQGFVNLLKDNFNRLVRAIDRDPNFEVAGMQEGVDRNLVDSLRSQIDDNSQALQKANSDIVAMERLLGQEQADHRRDQERAKSELARIKNINDALQKGYEADSARIEAEHRSVLLNIEATHKRQTDELIRQRKVLEHKINLNQDTIEKLQQAHKHTAETLRQRDEQTVILQKQAQQLEVLSKDLRTTIQQHEVYLSDAKAIILDREGEIQRLNEALRKHDRGSQQSSELLRQREEQLKDIRDKHQKLEYQIESIRTENAQLETLAAREETKSKGLEKRAQLLEAQGKQAQVQENEIRAALEATEGARKAAQSELDDLLIVLADLEDKRIRDKRKLKELGAEISDLEDEDGDDDEDEGKAPSEDEAEAHADPSEEDGEEEDNE